ncbi:MAG: hypothetical protein QM831_28440 [Kofleriaceae bacterium]
MIITVLLAILVLIDASLCGFRAAAGREGRIDKRALFRAAILRGFSGGVVIVAINAAVVAILVAIQPTLWTELVAAGTRAVWVFGSFATVTLAAITCWFVPLYESRIMPSILVLGPLTMLRPLVIIAGLIAAAAVSRDPRVWFVAALGGASLLSLERILGRRHVDRWRRFVRS